MKTLVTGATGTVGRHVVDHLLAANVDVRALTRRPDSAGLPASAEIVGGDLDQPDTLASAFEGVDRMYLVVTSETEQVVKLATGAGVRRIVVLSSARRSRATRAATTTAPRRSRWRAPVCSGPTSAPGCSRATSWTGPTPSAPKVW